MATQSPSQEVAWALDATFSNTALFDIARRFVAPRSLAFVDQHTRRGRFLGGPKAFQGYSSNPLPTFYLGNLVKTGDGYRIVSEKFRTSINATGSVYWRWVSGGPMSFFEGGYKGFRKLAGRQTNHVDYTMTGDMLRGLDYRIKRHRDKTEIRIGVYNHRREIAGYLNKDREFLGLHEDEISRVESDIRRAILNSFPED